MSEQSEAIKPISLTDLPALMQPLEGGVFLGVITLPDDRHYAIVKLNDKPNRFLTFRQAVAWAKSVHGELPSQAVAQMAFCNARDLFKPKAHWTCEVHHEAYSWSCDFETGERKPMGIMTDLPVFAVRLISLVGNAEAEDLHKRVELLEARFATVSLQERIASLEALVSSAR